MGSYRFPIVKDELNKIDILHAKQVIDVCSKELHVSSFFKT